MDPGVVSDGGFNQDVSRPTDAMRERVVAAIYESVIRPDIYDSFMEAWGQHISDIVEAYDAGALADGAEAGAVALDPALEAHFARAYEIFEQVGRRTPSQLIGERIARSPGIAMLFDSKGALLAASEAARAHLDADAALDSLRRELGAHSAEVLSQMMRQADAGEANVPPAILATGWSQRHLVARIVPSPADGGQPRQTVAIEALEYQWNEEAEAVLVMSFALSRAEVDLVRHLLSGLTLRQIAETTGRSEHTVRNQAKSVLSKTGAPSQVDLVRMVVFLIREPGTFNAGLFDDFREEIWQMGSTGKAMQLVQVGPESGRPVIFMHGMLDGLAAVHQLRDRARAAKIRLIVPVRPGFGKSEAAGRGEDVLDLVEAHVREVMVRLGLRRPILMSHLAGNVYGQMLLGRLGKKVAGMLSVSGNPPVKRLSQLSRMPKRQRVVAYTARFAPALLPTILRAGIAQIDGQGVDYFREALFAPGTHDAAAIERLDLAELLHAGFRFSVEQGMSGFAADSALVVNDWSRHLGNLEVPVVMLNGKRDLVVLPDSVEREMSGIRNLEVRMIEDAGQLLIYEHPDRVIAALEELLARR